MKIQQTIKTLGLEPLLVASIIGVEKEGQRVFSSGNVATTNHPGLFGGRHYHPYIQTDFAESQLELITPPCSSIGEATNWLEAIHEVVLRSLPNDEWLWPFSIPATLPSEEDIRIAKLNDQTEVDYRCYLAEKYGKSKQMVSGIHFNFEFHPELLQRLAVHLGHTDLVQTVEFTNALYFKVAKNYLRYEWIITYLFGASPYAPQSYFTPRQEALVTDVRSVRSSRYGYVNDSEVCVSYDSLVDYITSVETMVADRRLMVEKELYEAVRFRGAKRLNELLTKGIGYLEFRSFDLNPYERYGIGEQDLRFLSLFIQLMAWIDEEASASDVAFGKSLKDQVALQHPFEPAIRADEGKQLLERMCELVIFLPEDERLKMLEYIADKQCQFKHPEQTVAARMIVDFPREDIATRGMEVARFNKAFAQHEPFALKGFTQLELSTQIVMFDAIQKGVHVDVLDASDQFLALTYDGKTEYVKNGNMTSHDSVSSMLAMANKVVTKKILAQHGIRVPFGYECYNLSDAKALWPRLQGKAIVVKPKSTNYGIGITIFKQAPTQEDYFQAVAIAFQADQSILIEQYYPGVEYRFFVMGDETKAVLLRKPAHVEGDGIHTIRELIEIKNKHHYRGYGHQYPLTKIELGEIEQLMLKQQNWTADSIVPKGVEVFLRENSNISTGGDSIDVTDEMPDYYKQIAGQAAKALHTKITGIDMIIPNSLTSKEETKHSKEYVIIEANFNPAMMMQIYPAQGKGRRLSLDVLHMLFPTLATD